MKLKSAWILAVLCCAVITGCRPAVELESLEGYLGKYSAVSRFSFDEKYSGVKPHGMYLEKQGDDYFMSLWYDAIDGEVRKERAKLVVKQDPTTMKSLGFTT